MVLPPQRGAPFAYSRGHEHQLGVAKWSSRLRSVRILKTELSPARGAHFHALLCKTNVFGAPPEVGMPVADVPSCFRLHAVLFFEQNGALASTPCAFRFKLALEQ